MFSILAMAEDIDNGPNATLGHLVAFETESTKTLRNEEPACSLYQLIAGEAWRSNGIVFYQELQLFLKFLQLLTAQV